MYNSISMKDDYLKHEDNLVSILDNMILLCRQSGLSDLAKKTEGILKNYISAKKLREYSENSLSHKTTFD